MKLMAWSEHFVTGIASVDAQHHALVDMINAVAPSLALGAEDAKRIASPLLDKLIRYAATHFKHEEDLMTQAQVLPEYFEQHHRTHQAFVEEVLQMRQQYEQTGHLSGQDLLQFLTSWLSFHILSEDKRMASQVQAIQHGDTAEHAYTSLSAVGGAPNAVYTAALIDLFSLLSQRNRSLLQANAQLVTAQAELEAANRSLESRVAERTQELTQTNAALQTERQALVLSMQQLERTQSQLLQSEKMAAVGQLAAGVAHEINNPIGFVTSNIGSLSGYVTQLLALTESSRQDSVHWPEAQRQSLQASLKQMDFEFLREDVLDLLRESKEGLDRVKRIVGDLRDFARDDEVQWQPTNINTVLESALCAARPEIEAKAVLVKELAELPEVPCITVQLKQVLVNLLVNAAQSIQIQGQITVRSGHDEQGVWVEISDTGCGMSDEMQKRIFEPFYTTKPVGQGTGLGLTMSWEIMQRHQGQIEVHSTLGQGTTFRLVLPRRACPLVQQ